MFYELSPGGARRAANDLGKELLSKHQVDAYIVDTTNIGYEKECYSKVYFNRFVDQSTMLTGWKKRLVKDTVTLFKLYILHRKISKQIDRRHYDIVLVFSSQYTQSPFLLHFLKTKKIYLAHDIYRAFYKPIFRYRKSEYPFEYIYQTCVMRMRKYFDASNVNHADTVVVPSKYTQRNFLKYYRRKSIVCYPGVNANFFSPIDTEKTIDLCLS